MDMINTSPVDCKTVLCSNFPPLRVGVGSIFLALAAGNQMVRMLFTINGFVVELEVDKYTYDMPGMCHSQLANCLYAGFSGCAI